jgi:hypothetical protein
MSDKIEIKTMTRRQFIGTAAALSAIFAFPSILLGKLGKTEESNFHFSVAGDSHMYRYGEEEKKIHLGFEKSLCPDLKKSENGPGEFMILVGDTDPFYKARDAVKKHMGDSYGFYPVIGNHDLPSTANYGKFSDNWVDTFDIVKYNKENLKNIVNWGPDVPTPALKYTYKDDKGNKLYSSYDRDGINGAKYTTYSFDKGNTHFVVLDEYATNAWGPRGNGRIWQGLYDWLKKDLASTKKPHILVFGHETIWDHATIDVKPVPKEKFWDLLKKNNVAAYFCGHVHNYHAEKFDGVWEIRISRGYNTYKKSHFAKVYIKNSRIEVKVFQLLKGYQYQETHVIKTG